MYVAVDWPPFTCTLICQVSNRTATKYTTQKKDEKICVHHWLGGYKKYKKKYKEIELKREDE